MCGVVVETDGARVLTLRGDREDPLSAGHICPKALGLKDVHEDPERLRRPLRRRVDGSFEEVSWEAALDEAAERVHAVQRAHGRHAVGLYLGNPNVHNHGALLFAQLLLRTLRSRSVFSATSVDQLPHMLASYLMFGHQLLFPVPDIDRAGFLLMLGANPLASNGSLLTAPGIERRLKALRARGGTLVVVDPRRTETAALASQHLPIRPGRDAFLLLALLHVVTREGLTRPGRLAEFSQGLDGVAALADDMPPERAAGLTGLDAVVIRALARDFATAPAAVAYGRMGVSTQAFGGLCAWLVNLLNVLTGNLDRAGGAMFTRPAVNLVELATRIGQRGSFARRHTRVRALPEFSGEWPAAALAEEIDTPGDGQIRALITLAGNPVLSTPNGTRLERALPGLDSLIAIDFYLNEASRHAHLILPPTFALERDHYDVVFHLLAVRNTAKYSPALFQPAPDARHDWQILLGLSTRLLARRGQRLRATALRALLGGLGPTGLVAALLRFGPHGQGARPFGPGLSLRRLRAQPHGVDLGALEPCLPARLCTPDRRIALLPSAFVDDLTRLRTHASALEQAAAAPAGRALALIGRRDLRSNNSWLHNSARLVKGRERCTLLMHPDDAAARQLSDGQRVRVRSRSGSVNVPLQVTDTMRPGVVSLPHGWGHDRPGTRLSIASARPGASLNDITDEQQVDLLSGTAAFSGVPVEVEAAG
jgi:anaerobic selenocysteine-containing dehydrogenase